MKITYMALVAFLVSGCAAKVVSIDSNDTVSAETAASADVYFVADNQVHIYNGFAYPVENYLSDKISGVAVRPPQTAVFAPFAYKAFLKGLSQSPLLIHLGDGADVSCQQELNRFFDAMEGFSGPWVFVPGNHDGFYTGNSQYNSTNTGEWDHACVDKRLDKTDAIVSYLHRRFGRVVSKSNIDGSQIVQGTWTTGAVDGSYLASIKSDPDEAHRSYIIQRVTIGLQGSERVEIVILDTSHYRNPPKYRNVALPGGRKIAGFTGEILKEQMDVATEWLSEAKGAALVLIAGHHPLKRSALTADGLAWYGGTTWLRRTMEKYDVAGYVSAHTHKGGSREIWDGKTEWNVASLVDWPLGMRAMWLGDNGLEGFREVLFVDDETPQGISGKCGDSAGWKFQKEDFHYYTRYRDQKLTGPTGKYMQHYLLVAELISLVEAVDRLDSTRKYSTLVSEQRRFIAGAIHKFYQRRDTESEGEIEDLHPRLESTMKALEALVDAATGKELVTANRYFWCQLWWAAKEDAQRQWDVDNVTGHRRRWD